MSAQIIRDRPPNYGDIIRVFPQATRQTVIFAYAPDIYAPAGLRIPDELIAHEAAHIARQEQIGVKEWWERYLADPEFRYFEELIAHVAEYQHLILEAPNRNMRRSALKGVAKKLAAPLYGRLVTPAMAERDILDGLEGKGPRR